MRGGLRRLHQPLQVPCVLVAVLLTAAFSLQFIDHAGARAPLRSADHNCRGESTVAIVSGNPQATYNSEIRRRAPQKWRELTVDL